MNHFVRLALSIPVIGLGCLNAAYAGERSSIVDSLALESFSQRKPTLDLANQAALAKGLTLEALGKACNVLPIRVGAVLTGQAPLEKASQDCLETQLGLASGAMTPLATPPVRWQAGAVYRMHEAIEVYGPAIQRWFNERYGDAIMSAIDFNVTVEETKGAKGERRIRIVFDGKALPYSGDDGWRPVTLNTHPAPSMKP
jgi:cyanate lyase